MRAPKNWLLGAIGIGLVASMLAFTNGQAASNNGNGNGVPFQLAALQEEFDALKSAFTAQQSTVGNLQGMQTSQDQLIAQLKAENAQQDLVIKSLQTTSADQVKQIKTLETQSAEQTTAISSLQSKSAAQDQLIQTLNARFTAQDQTIAGLNAQLLQTGEVIKGYEAQLPAWMNKANALQTENDAQAAQIIELQNRLNNLQTPDYSGVIGQLNGKIAAQEDVITSLQAQLAALEAKLANLGSNPQLPGGTTTPTQPNPGTEPTQPTPGTDPTKPIPGTDPSQPTPGTDPTKPIPGTDPSQPTPGTDPTKPIPGTDPSQPTPGTDPSQPAPGTGPTKPTDEVILPQLPEPTVPTKPTPVPTAKGSYEESSSLINYTGVWTDFSAPQNSGGAVKYTGEKGASFKVNFTGTALQIVGYKSKYMGIADVFIDGNKVASIDYYAASTIYKQVLFTAAGLELGEHTVEIVATGTKNSAALNSNINIDKIVVE
ncbi:hypothetical protein EV586_1116 [Tumebacillus sp. BK434]|uniref:hypothetical protein n=1 Tax=Tumebacillus sp. BK434 TaxID=2512169 RepID=UPI001044CBD2|nr:hypothetical protein [Tumebacillus sp. BK434]TCP52330.1 hypothetical protein EV586_1116 [Tumebacillus sp. BK434]